MLKQIFLTAMLFFTVVSFAQQGTTSPYSFYGIGTLQFKGTAENRAMGGISVYSDSIHLNVQNPAGVAGLRLVNYSVGGSHLYETLKTDNDNTKASTTSLSYIAVGVPMGKFGASFGLIPYSAVGYKLQTEIDSTTIQNEGSGGLNRAFVALAYEITPKLSVGVDASYNFGNIRNTKFTVQENIQFGTRETNRSDLRGFSLNFGAAYKTMVSENLELSTSFMYTPGSNFTSENTREIGTVIVLPGGNESAIDNRPIDEPDSEFTFPSQFTLGAGIGAPKKWFVGAEYTSQKTSNFTNTSFSLDNVEFKNAGKFRLGGFYIPNYNAIGSYWQRVVYRAGMRFEQTGIAVNKEDINEFGISFGVGLPVGRLFSNVNLGFEIGKRGTKNFGLIQENFFNTIISLSLNDRWFEKRYYD